MASEDKVQNQDPILSTKEAAVRLGVSHRTLQDWRRKWRKGKGRQGPPFIPISSRKTGYRQSDIDAWLRARQVG